MVNNAFKSISISIILTIVIFAIVSSPWANTDSFLITRLIFSVIIGLFCFGILFTGKIWKWRSILFILICASFIIYYKTKVINPYNQDSFICHIGGVSTLSSTLNNLFLALKSKDWKVWWPYSIGVVWLLGTLIAGKLWCSWVCFFGGIDEFFSRLLPKPIWKIKKVPLFLRNFPLGFLIFILLITFYTGESVYCNWMCPLKLTCGILGDNGWIKTIQTILFITCLVILLIILPLITKKRMFCAFFCPFVGWRSTVMKVNPYKISIDKSSCTKCGSCEKACPVFAIDEKSMTDGKSADNCTLCGRCIDECPNGSARIKMFLDLEKKADKGLDVTETIFVFTALLITGLVSSGFMMALIERW